MQRFEVKLGKEVNEFGFHELPSPELPERMNEKMMIFLDILYIPSARAPHKKPPPHLQQKKKKEKGRDFDKVIKQKQITNSLFVTGLGVTVVMDIPIPSEPDGLPDKLPSLPVDLIDRPLQFHVHLPTVVNDLLLDVVDPIRLRDHISR